MNMVAAINASAASVLDTQAAELEETLIERARALEKRQQPPAKPERLASIERDLARAVAHH